MPHVCGYGEFLGEWAGIGPTKARRKATGTDSRQINRYYRWISKFYGFHEQWFERALREKTIEFLHPIEGERILEIGCGTGLALREIAGRTGPSGSIHGLDVSPDMLQRARVALGSCSATPPVFMRADAATLPYADGLFDGAYMSGVLELYDEPQRLQILTETRRVLKPGTGRLALAVMRDDGKASGLLRFYEWARRVIPGVIPSTSVDADPLLREVGFRIEQREKLRLKGLLPVEVILARV
jgi:ubiquinone/menaquinone biosynthesis C-methylase UbiE